MQLECYIPLFLGLYNVFFTIQVIGGLVLEEEIKFPVSIFEEFVISMVDITLKAYIT